MIPSRCTAPAMTLGLCHHLTQQFCDSQQTRSTTPKNMSRVQSLAPATKNGHGHLWSATAQIDFRQSFPKMVPPNHLIFGFSINHKPSWTIHFSEATPHFSIEPSISSHCARHTSPGLGRFGSLLQQFSTVTHRTRRTRRFFGSPGIWGWVKI